tara:strand:+ start:252 stop:1460 length:1209 start_codon:yes stop_codon:yes gene_type:complete
MSKILINILFLFFLSNLTGQEKITISGDFLPYETYYIGSVDLITGESDVQLFNFLINSTTASTDEEGQYINPVRYHAEFKLEVLSSDLGFDERETIIKVRTRDMISMQNPIKLDNRDFNFNSVNIFDITGQEVLDENGSAIIVDVIDIIDIENHEKILSAITSRGQLPDGEYIFTFRLFAGDIDEEKVIKTINVSTPKSVDLIYPGGILSDTTQNIIYTSLPIFQWYTETCSSCELFIRVAEFNPMFHNSIEDAIEDVTSLPLNQVQGWELIDNVSFQYPINGAKALEEGKLYVWQIKKEFQTTLGTDSYLSPISIFKIANFSTYTDGTNINIFSDPILLALKELIGEESFKIYFGIDGDLSNYLPNNVYRINKENCNATDILRIIEQLRNGTISIVNLNIE